MDPSLRTWATAHARTIGTRRPGSAPPPLAPTPPPPRRPSGPIQVTTRKFRDWPGISELNEAAWTILPDGRPLLATASGTSSAGVVGIWDGHTRLHTLTGHTGYVSSVAWAQLPGGQLLLASGGGGGDGDARIWDGHTGALLRTIDVDNIVVYSLAWAVLPDGQPLLATGSLGNPAAQIWDGETGTIVHRLTGHTSLVESVAWAQPAGRPPLLATGSQDNTVRVWDGDTGACLHTLTGHTQSVREVAWTVLPDGRPLLASGGYDRFVHVWDGDTGTLLHTLPSDSAVSSLDWTILPDGQPLLAVADGGETHIWDVNRQVRVATVFGGVAGVWARLPDGRLLLAAGSVRAFAVWEVTVSASPADQSDAPVQGAAGANPSKSKVKRVKEITPYPLARDTSAVVSAAVAVTPDGRPLIATADSDGVARVSEGDTGTMLYTLRGPRTRVAWAPSGEGLRLVTANAQATVDLWDGHSGAHLHTRSPSALFARVRMDTQSLACAVLPDGQLHIAYGDSGGLLFWDERHGESPLTCPVCAAPVRRGDLICVNCGANLVRREAPAACPVCATPAQQGDSYCVNCGTSLAQREAPAASLLTCPVCAAPTRPGAVICMNCGANLARRLAPEASRQRNLNFAPQPSGVASLDWAILPDAGLRLAVGYRDGSVRIWDGHTGEELRASTRDESVAARIRSVAWAQLPDGRLRLAIGCEDGTTVIRDGNTLAPLHTVAHRAGSVRSVAWAALPDGRLLLATAGSENIVRIWDGHTGEPASAPLTHGARVEAVDWALLPDGRLLLVTGGPRSGPRIKDGDIHSALRIREVELDPPIDASAPTAPVDHVSGTQDRAGALPAVVSVLLACGSADLWPPLGLLEDLVALTGRGGRSVALHDERLRPLTDHPGIQRLRELGWPARARLAFAVLLASRLSLDTSYSPPTAATNERLREALSAALAELRSPAVPSGVHLDELRAVADTVADRSVALLTIIGPGAASADPLLPLRLSHYVPRLPVLGDWRLRLLSATRSARTDQRPGGGTEQHAPGTAGVSRHGALTQLLPTQLALPRDLLTVRQLGDQLLYRRHVGQIPPAPQSVILILDTTPPTHGPAEQVLRLAAHLITTTLWEYDEHPILISLTQPATAVPLTEPAHLITTTLWEYDEHPILISLTQPETSLPLTEPAHLLHLWSTRTLEPPGPALATALQTARGESRPTVVLTHHHTAEQTFPPGTGGYLLTTHHPPEPTPTAPAHPRHYHLPPNPTQTQLTQTVQAILTHGPEDPPSLAMNATNQNRPSLRSE